ncbi:MAG: YbbR-like domain-containing protein [Spirochaetales bacterium]|nr:YbbR-like domain-containing protein [Spirochaetales bacterium]
MKLKSSTLWQRLRSNWYAKVISLLASIFIFIFYRISTQDDILVPLENISLPNGYAIAEEFPQSIKIILRGNKSKGDFTKENFRASVDLSGFTKGGIVRGDVKMELLGDAQKLGSLEYEYTPTIISFQLEEVMEKYVSVDIAQSISGVVPKGYHLESYSVTPETILIYGPKSMVAGIETIRTERIDLTGRTGTVNRTLEVFTPNRLISLVDTREVNFFGLIGEKKVTQVFEDVDINFVELSDRLSITGIPAGKFEIETTELYLEKLKKEQLRLIVDCSGVHEPGEYILIPKPESPGEVQVLSYEPEKLKIRFEWKKE